MSCDVLFLSPHPDDVDLFCGGTVAHLAAGRRDVVIADLTRGELASNGTPESRREASLRAVAILGARTERPVLGLPDGGIDPHDDEQVVAVVRTIRELRPRWTVAPWIEDRHPDHEAAGHLARRAHFLAGIARHAPDAGPAFRSEKLLFYPCHHDVDPGLLVDVSEHMDTWSAAIAAYAEQFRRDEGRAPTPINRPGFVDAEAGRRARWGQRIGVAHAEAFVTADPWAVSFVDALRDGNPEEAR